MQRLAETHPDVVREIQDLVDACATIVASTDPLDLLHHAHASFFHGMLGKASEHEVDTENCVDLRMLDYVQAVIVSQPPAAVVRKLDEERWNDLRARVSKLFDLLLSDWPLGETATRQVSGAADAALERFRMPILLEWLAVRGSRYSVHERERAEALLRPHDERLQAIFATDSARLGTIIEQVQVALTKGLGEAMRELHAIHSTTMDAINLDGFVLGPGMSTRDALRELLARVGLKDRLDAAAERAFGLALFDVTEIFPPSLLPLISLSPGDDPSFFREGDYRGWPLRTPPTCYRPILRVEERFYLFNPYAIDSLYSAVQFAVLTADPTYKDGWNAGQKKATEDIPVELFTAMLPGARVLRDVYYPVEVKGKTQWCECDALLILDDLLVVLEAKGGRPSVNSPFIS